jgi:hypothetical protein
MFFTEEVSLVRCLHITNPVLLVPWFNDAFVLSAASMKRRHAISPVTLNARAMILSRDSANGTF